MIMGVNTNDTSRVALSSRTKDCYLPVKRMTEQRKTVPIPDMERRGTIQISVPVYNEGENINVLYSKLVSEGIEFDSLKFVYDSDTDTTLPYIEELHRNDSRVRTLKNELSPGVVNALRFAFLHCDSGPLIILMGDNSDKLSLIPDMITCWKEGVTIVCPSRYMPGGQQYGGGILKSGLSRFAGLSLKLIGFPTSDATNNFKLYDGDWVRSQEIESAGGFEIALELCYKAYLAGKEIRELPTVWRPRIIGKSRFKLIRWLPHYLRWYLKTVWAVLRRLLRGC